jgi:hypothetical protein
LEEGLGAVIDFQDSSSALEDDREAIAAAQDKIVDGTFALAAALDTRNQRLRDLARECDDLKAELDATRVAIDGHDALVDVVVRFLCEVDRENWEEAFPFRVRLAVDELRRLVEKA